MERGGAREQDEEAKLGEVHGSERAEQSVTRQWSAQEFFCMEPRANLRSLIFRACPNRHGQRR